MTDQPPNVKPQMPDAAWLVFVRASVRLSSFGMTRARSGIWYARRATEFEASSLIRRLGELGLRAWSKYETDMPQRQSRQLRHARELEFAEYRASMYAEPTTVRIAADPNRDRSGGRSTYSEYRGNQTGHNGP